MNNINFRINNKKLFVPNGSMIITISDKIGIPIPRFCYHKKFEDLKSIYEVKFVKGLDYFLNGYLKNQEHVHINQLFYPFLIGRV